MDLLKRQVRFAESMYEKFFSWSFQKAYCSESHEIDIDMHIYIYYERQPIG